MHKPFPSLRLRLFMLLYAALWGVLLPFTLLYLWRRGRKDKLYFAHLMERFGRHRVVVQNPVWVHAVSLGEMRSATPLIRALLAHGEHVVTTHFTPTGRREAMREFAKEIAAGTVQVVWVPLEYRFAINGFLRAFTPKYGLVMEIEIWPQMIMTCRAAHMPLFMCNAQYPSKSYTRDTNRTPLRAEVMRGFAGALVKSQLQRERFETVGVQNIAVTGELRFDQPISPQLINAGVALRDTIGTDRQVIALTSVVVGEDAGLIDMIAQIKGGPLFIYVPRAPERFDEVYQMLVAANLNVVRRSEILDANLSPHGSLKNINVLLGDSMGEMYGYLAASDRAIIGGSFHPKGAHNIIEPLALMKPVILGPHIWTIEYPAVEALAAGVCTQVATTDDLGDVLRAPAPDAQTVSAFFDDHAGATVRTMAAIPKLLENYR